MVYASLNDLPTTFGLMAAFQVRSGSIALTVIASEDQILMTNEEQDRAERGSPRGLLTC